MEGLLKNFSDAFDRWTNKRSSGNDYQSLREMFEADYGQIIDPEIQKLYLSYIAECEEANQQSILTYPAWSSISEDPNHPKRHLLNLLEANKEI